MSATARMPGQVLEEAEKLEARTQKEEDVVDILTKPHKGLTIGKVLIRTTAAIVLGFVFSYFADAYMAEHTIHLFGSYYLMH